MSQYPHGDPVEEARLLLPWYITGKLSETERKLVEAMLTQHPELQDEYHRELKMVDMIRANTGLLQLSAVDTTHQRLDKLMKRIGYEEQVKARIAAVPRKSPKTWLWTARKFLRDVRLNIEWLTPANAVFATLLLLQAGFLGWFSHSAISQPDGIYRAASVVEDNSAIPVAKGLVLLVDFHADAQVRQVRDFLHQWDARILDGPDDNNLFKIEVKGVQPSDKQQSSVILQKMEKDQAVVAFVGRQSSL